MKCVENEVWKCSVWKMQSVENGEGRKCRVWKCSVWKMPSVENAECGNAVCGNAVCGK